MRLKHSQFSPPAYPHGVGTVQHQSRAGAVGMDGKGENETRLRAEVSGECPPIHRKFVGPSIQTERSIGLIDHFFAHEL